MRMFAEQACGIPPEQVVGSTADIAYRHATVATLQLIKRPKVEFFDDGPDRLVSIDRAIGHRSISAFGNSNGVAEILEQTSA